MTNVAILGSGEVGAAGASASVGTYAKAAAWGELIVLAVKGSAAVEVLSQAGLDNFSGKTVIDTTNPIAEGKPDNGVLRNLRNDWAHAFKWLKLG